MGSEKHLSYPFLRTVRGLCWTRETRQDNTRQDNIFYLLKMAKNNALTKIKGKRIEVHVQSNKKIDDESDTKW